ncbi:hypothetical protein FO519_009452 [Halicephalobus sp. NKZ332]|nr:hypothetical protein FO519_009452 [Halicephalobus sp. NKZ332]
MIPCSESVNITFFDDIVNPHIFCAISTVYINFTMDEKCASETDLIAVHYDITKNSVAYGKVSAAYDTYYLEFTRTVIPANYSIGIWGEFDSIIDTTDISLFLTLYRISQPKLVETLFLNNSTTHIFYDLTKLTDNSYIEIDPSISKDIMVDYFFVTDSHYGVLDFYNNFFQNYVGPIEQIEELQPAFNARRFMPKRYNVNSFDQCLIYTEKQDKNHSAFVFARKSDVKTRNCLFEHDVIDAKLLAEADGTLTMANNGTEPCIVTLLNPFREKRIYLDEFWTDAVSDPIEVHDDKELLFNFTKFNKIGKYYLEGHFYRFVLPIGTSFTVTGHDDKLS